jgi:tRNA nucleotidyltransferase (CCA-adding enzyme)
LFYNVATETIEDFTQRGLSDLKARVARTPLPPRQTFLDDPLRVLRTIRFAGRYNLRVEQEVADAARDAEIQVSYLWIVRLSSRCTRMMKLTLKAALRTKVSKERIGIEITKTFAKSPLDSLHLIQDLGLHSSIFTCPGLPESAEPAADTRGSAVVAARAVEQVRQRWPEMGDVPGLENVWLGAALQPYEGLMVVGKKEVPAVSVCVAEGLKVSVSLRGLRSQKSQPKPRL